MPSGTELGETREVPPERSPTATERDFTGPERVAHYEVLRELGAGGMGTVYEAHDLAMDRRVALKVLSRHMAPSEKSARRFEKEAWIAGKLDHPNIVKVYERGTWEELHFFSMELVDGGSLHDVLRNMRRWGRDDRWGLSFGSREYLHWVIGQIVLAARALDYAHRNDVVHRDIKPMNLLLGRELGQVKIADFGLAYEESATRMTTAGKVMGTLAYMAPEQILGKRERVGPRTDVYALGATLFELLTLELPYRGDTQQLYMNAVLTSEARRLRKLNERISRDLETVVRKALEKNPEDRYAGAGDLADDLENVLNLRPIRARPSRAWTRAFKWTRRKPIHAALIVVLAVGVPVTAVFTQRELHRRTLAREARIELLLKEARGLSAHGRYHEVLDRVAAIHRLQTDNPRALARRAIARTALARQGDDAGRRAAWRAGALEDAAGLVALQPQEAWRHTVQGVVLRRLGDAEKAVLADDRAAALRRGAPAIEELELRVELAIQDAAAAAAGTRDERFQEALRLLGELQRRRPDDVMAVALRGLCFDYLGDDDRAYAEYRIAAGLDPTLARAFLGLARVTLRRQELEEAESWVQRALELAPEAGLVHEALAELSIEMGKQAALAGDEALAERRYREGEAAARRAIDLSPFVLHGHVNLGASLAERARLSEPPDAELLRQAAAAYEELLSRWSGPPQDADSFDAYTKAIANTCDVLIQLRRLESALATCRRAVELAPGNAVGHYNLAAVYALGGSPEEAFAALERDFELGDDDWQWLSEDPWFSSLRSDPRFRKLVAAMQRRAGSRSE